MRIVVLEDNKPRYQYRHINGALLGSYGEIIATYHLECEFHGGPCITSCKHLLVVPADRLYVNLGVRLQCAKFTEKYGQYYLGYLYDPIAYIKSIRRGCRRVNVSPLGFVRPVIIP